LGVDWVVLAGGLEAVREKSFGSGVLGKGGCHGVEWCGMDSEDACFLAGESCFESPV